MDDLALRKLVEDELEWEPSVNAADIGVIVESGIVRLTGHVPSYAQKMAAEAAVKRVKGVRGLVEDVEVQPYLPTTSDESIASRLANVFDWDSVVPKGRVKVKVDDGFVTLAGEVDWRFQKTAAELRARNLAGVRHVSNMIQVAPRPRTSDVKRKIEDALERHAHLEANNIKVTVTGDKIRLKGRVDTWSERELVENAAWAAPGVRAVEDQLRVGS